MLCSARHRNQILPALLSLLYVSGTSVATADEQAADSIPNVRQVPSVTCGPARTSSVFEGPGVPQEVLSQGAGEGPAWHPEVGLVFSGEGRINRLTANNESQIYESGSATNGLLFDKQGRLLRCESELGRITRKADKGQGTLEILTDSYQGKKYNQPNDIAVDSQGRIYFSDPLYGPRDRLRQFDAEGRGVEGVYRIDLDGTTHRIITHEADRPNGVLVSQDDRYLYVADNNNNTPQGARILWRFDLRADGAIDPASRKEIYDWGTGRGPDGMAQDRDGRIYVAGGLNKPNLPYETVDAENRGGIYVFDPESNFLEFISIPRDEVTNCAFGGTDLKELFITAGGSLWKIRTISPGALP